MLKSIHTYAGSPTSGLQYLALPKETLLLYSYIDSIIILNARTLAFLRALAFWEAFPSALHANETIQCLAVDPGMKLIVASMGPRLAAWSMSGVNNEAWRVHSSLLIPDGQHVTAIDCRSGLLSISTPRTLSVYTLVLEHDLPSWSQKWSLPISTLSQISFSPSLMYIAGTSIGDNAVYIYLTTSGKRTQRIRHPRAVENIIWRKSQASSRDDLVLYTVTSDSTLRIFAPVLDSPQHLELHASLDLFTAVPFSTAAKTPYSRVFCFDRVTTFNALTAVLNKQHPDVEDSRDRRIREIVDEGWDLFMRILHDGSLVVQAIANIDRRPPTLPTHFALLHSQPSTVTGSPSCLCLLPNPSAPDTLIVVSSPPLKSHIIHPMAFLDARPDGLTLVHCMEEILPPSGENTESRPHLIRFVRTLDGSALAALQSDGTVDIWCTAEGERLPHRLVTQSLERGRKAEQVVVLDDGKYFATYDNSVQSMTLHASDGSFHPTGITVPPIVLLFGIAVSMKEHYTILGVTAALTIAVVHICLPTSTGSGISRPTISLHSETHLPLETAPKIILPIDQMAWTHSDEPHDVVLSISANGDLTFWKLDTEGGTIDFKCTDKVRTKRERILMAACSSEKKTALICPTMDGQELTIWNSTESEFASGLEFRDTLRADKTVIDLDWAATPDCQSILAIGYPRHVEILCQQRMTYFDDTPGWGICWKIDLTNKIPYEINDSTWLKGGSLIIGSGPLVSLYGHDPQSVHEGESSESLFEYVTRQNGPLEDYHPQMMLQCLLWSKLELVKNIIINLAHNLERTRDTRQWNVLPVEDFFNKDEVIKVAHAGHKPHYKQLFVDDRNNDSEDEFSVALVNSLVDRLEEQPLPHLTLNEHESLVVLIQTVLEVEQQRRALDENGLRYVTSMRIFHNYNRRSSMSTPSSSDTKSLTQTQRRERLRYRDIIWAFHSESQDLLLSTSTAACKDGKMCWPDAKALGVFIWLRSVETMKAHMEVLARNQYMAGENRDPVQCSLFYFALGKVKLVHGLWRQAAWHPEQGAMLKFLNNDFSTARWRTAALKNAFALLSKRRFEYAAAFFLLGGSLKDAVNVCIKNLQDFQLAIALARVVEQGDSGPILRDILTNVVVPTAFREGNRWLASWAFWLLRRRDLAVRILISPLQDMCHAWDPLVTEIGESNYDDSSLALLFSYLKHKTLQAAQGTSEISGRTEFKFVLQIARVFRRMGCHALALDLVRSWSFERPSTAVHDSPTSRRPPSPIATRFALEPAMRRQSTIMIDMDIPTEPPTRSASPTLPPTNGATLQEDAMADNDGDLIARKAGMGRLMKSAKQDVHVPEFDMNAFF